MSSHQGRSGISNSGLLKTLRSRSIAICQPAKDINIQALPSHDPVTLTICSVPSRFCPNQAHLFPITPPWQPRLRRNPYPQLTNSASCPACFCLCRSQTSASHRQSSVSSKTPFAVLHPNRTPGKCRTPVKADLHSTTNPIRNQRCPPIKPFVSCLLFSILIQDFF